MSHFPEFLKRYALILLLGAFSVGQASANGEFGNDINHLEDYLDQYTAEIKDMNTKVGNMVDTYAAKGAAAVDTAQVIDWWEAVKVHGAIETNLITVYASIWQGIVGLQHDIAANKPVAQVRQRQQQLAQALWQGLGVVKLAAKYQSQGLLEKRKVSKSDRPIAEILENLNKVVIGHAEGRLKEARELVHDTYMNIFEGVEGELIEQDADLVEELEKDFNVTLPQGLEKNADQVAEVVRKMEAKLKKAEQLLEQSRANEKDVF